MANIDIFNLEPTKISRDLSGKFILLYGAPKAGKTSFSVQFPKPLLIAFEHGYNALPGVYAQDVTSWSDFKKIVQQLKLPQAREHYETIVIDTVGIGTDLCEKYILAQNDVHSLGEIPWGAGWSLYRKEFETPLRELSQLGYGIVFIAHEKNKPTDLKDNEGNSISSVFPDINKTGLNAVNRLVDVIAYLSVDFKPDGTSERCLYTRQTPTIFAGSRYKYLVPKIPFGYETLVNAIADAIEKEVADGAQANDHTEIANAPTYNYSQLMAEAKELWSKLTANNNAANVEKIQASITRVFGRPMKLSETKETQVELLAEVVADMKTM